MTKLKVHLIIIILVCFAIIAQVFGGTKPTQAEQKPQEKLVQDLDEAISKAIVGRSDSYLRGETAIEGHVILHQEEKDNEVKVYTVSSFRWLGFENGIFTSVSGSGNIPTVMKFYKNQQGEYSLLDYKEPMDGADYTDSIKKMFPKSLWDKVLTSSNRYPEITRQMEDKAREYLQQIGRNAEVRVSTNVDKILVNINVEASNKLFTEYTKDNIELNNFPYWIGTKEYIINGIRYIYETSQSKTEDGSDLITFRKTTEDKKIALEYKYKILGTDPQLITDASTIIYRNTQYGFSFALPSSWQGYSLITGKWEGLAIAGTNGEQVVQTGPLISIRHPKWTDKKPRQDIPIMIFTKEQWNQLQLEKFHIGAAPIGPRELGHNSKYVFALPARYNYAFPEGYEEVDKIIQSNPLKVEGDKD